MINKPEKKKKHSEGKQYIGALISLALTLSLLLLYLASRPEFSPDKGPGFEYKGIKYIGHVKLDLLNIIEAKTLNFRFKLRGIQYPKTDKVIIIAVDEKTHDWLGRWQSAGRLWIAQAVDILAKGGARTIGFDVSFSTPDESTALESIRSLKTSYLASQDGKIPDSAYLNHLNELEKEVDYDAQLEAALKRFGNAILGTYYFFSDEEIKHVTPEQSQLNQKIIFRTKYEGMRFKSNLKPPFPPLRVKHGLEVEPNIPRLSDAAKSFGHFNVIQDVDGSVRWVPLLIGYKGRYPIKEPPFENKIRYYPSLDLEIARFTRDLDPSKRPIIYVSIPTEEYGQVEMIQLGDITIPVDERGQLLINYYGPEKMFCHYSLADLIQCESITGKPKHPRCEKEKIEILPEEIKDKIVLVGWTGAISQDLHPTPFQENFPGVEIHATVIENILQEDFLTRPASTILLDSLIILILGLTTGFLFPKLKPVTGILLALLCLALLAGLMHAAFIYSKVWLNFTFPFLLITLNYMTLTSFKYFTEERHKREIRTAFQHYISPAVVDEILQDVDKLKLGGERNYLTAMFSDIRGFTSMSERMKPEELVHFLNEYLTAMTNVILDYKGTVDKYMGDAIMAFYGAPLPQEDHGVRACKTAIQMIEKLRAMRIQWEAQNYPFLDIGIGINSGEMVVGNMGSQDRFDYTVIGDEVNLASRLEGVNKQYGTNILISDNTYKLLKDQPFIVRELDRITVKGKKEPVTIYELIGEGTPSPEVQDFIKTFEEGLKEYRNQNWDKAVSYFEGALKIKAEDKACKLFIERCQDYKLNPPSADWDGVYKMKTK